MTKTFKMGAIIFISICLFLALRIVASMVDMADNYLDWSFTIFSQAVILGIVPLWLYKKWVAPEAGSIKRDFNINFNLHPLTYPLSFGLGVVLFFSTIFVSAIIVNIMQVFGYRVPASVGTIYSDNFVLIMSILCTAVLPGIFEEIFNRGLFLKSIEGVKSEKALIVLGGIFFGLFHENALQFGYAIFGGMVFVAIALKSKSIVPAMIMHFTNNLCSIMIGYSSQKLPAVYQGLESFLDTISAFGIIFIAVLLYLLFKGVKLMQTLNKDYGQDVRQEHRQDDSAVLQVEKRARWWEYGFIYATVVVTAITTVATFLWNFNG